MLNFDKWLSKQLLVPSYHLNENEINSLGKENIPTWPVFIDAKVEFIEYLGSEMNVHLTSQSNSFTARFNKKINSNSKEPISIILDVNKGHFFNIDNGNII